MIKALQFNLLLTIFLIPIITPFQSFGYEHSKILFFIFLTTLSGFLWIWLLHHKKIKLRWSAIKIISLIFIIILLLTSFFGVDLLMGMLGKEPYFQGWVIYAYLWLFSLMVAVAAVKQKDWIKAFSLSSALVSLVALRQFIEINFLGQYIPTYAGRVVSTFGQPNFYSGFLLLTLPLIPRKGYWWLVIFLNILAIIVSQSRVAYLMLSILMLIWLIKKLTAKKLLAIASLSFFLQSGLLWNQIWEPASTINPDLTKVSVENRVYIWSLSWQLILQQPLFGYGLENISTAFANYFEKNKHALFEENLKVSPVLISLKELDIDRTHNYLLDLLLFSGVAGTVVWLVLIWLLFKKAKNNKILLISLAAYLIWIQFQNQSVVHLIYFWLLVGLIDKGDIDKGRMNSFYLK